jgi:hypothetical protein
MTNLSDLRHLKKALRGAFTCPKCRKSIFVAGRSLTDHERIDPNKHCVCPGGPVDQAFGDTIISGEPPGFVSMGGLMPLRCTQRAREHSPTGFCWGYGGSGPAALAHSILAACVGEALADEYYQDFKWSVIAGLEQGKPWQMSVQQVLDWVSTQLKGSRDCGQ